MENCELCDSLAGKLSSVKPHQALELVQENKIKGRGMAKGFVEIYDCLVCGARHGRDLDSKDEFASWYRIK